MHWTRRNDAADGAGERLGEQGLADAGDVLDEEVAAGEERHDREPHRLGLAPEDAAEVREHVGGELGGVVQRAQRRHRSRSSTSFMNRRSRPPP